MRESGVLMHITSLPGPYGVGTLGKPAFDFIDFLKRAGQSCWQILPLTPTGYGDSPYQSCSAYAGNHYLIDLPLLVEEGLLKQEELDALQWCESETKVDFGRLYHNKLSVLRTAFERFEGGDEFDRFCRENSSWLSDFALYMAMKQESGGKSWFEWETGLKFREPDAVWAKRRELRQEIRFFSFVQYLFYRQWDALRDYAHQNGVHFIGDVPIYVPLDSVDVWADPELFQLDASLTPVAVAGCPPDGFSEDGQLWGNPLYRWDVMKRDGYSWWMRRLAAAGRLYDVVRLDHFRGFESYWSVPYGDKTAQNGRWIKGPDMDFFRAVKRRFPRLRLIAEDLGTLTPEVLELRDNSGYPGMKVLGFAFEGGEPSAYLPHFYVPNTVCYTATHDNMTTQQWFDTAPAESVAYAKSYMCLTEQEGLVWGVIRTAFSSVSDLCIVPLQDFLELGAEARMNFPGTMTDRNWTWRAKNDMITNKLADRIRKMTVLYCRLAPEKSESLKNGELKHEL